MSVALRVTVTAALCGTGSTRPRCSAIVEVGGVSRVDRISWLLVASALPALSQARYLTVVVARRERCRVDAPLDAVGSEPSVV